MASAADSYLALLERVPCNLCGSTSFSVVRPADYAAAGHATLEEAFRSSADAVLFDQLVRCSSCGLQYLNPRPSDSLILSAYAAGSDEQFVSQDPARRRTFRRAFRALRRHLPPQGTVLDVGAAGGAFLSIVREAGFRAIGCEPSHWLAQRARDTYQVDVRPGTLFDLDLAPSSVHLLTLWDVLEHTPDPAAVLARCRHLLHPDGLLAVNYPDIGSLPARLMGARWVFLLSVHLYYFDRRTISGLLARCGFEVVEIRRHWQSLELGYVLHRAAPYAPWLARPLSALVRALRLERAVIPYWIGQTRVLARPSTASAPPVRP